MTSGEGRCHNTDKERTLYMLAIESVSVCYFSDRKWGYLF